MNRQTYQAKPGDVEQHWHIVDAADQVLGRLSTKIAVILMGKHKPQYTPHQDVGDFVIIINADKIRLTGTKADDKVIQNFSGYPSGRTTRTYGWMLQHQPENLVTKSIQRMLPKNKLANQMIQKLKVYRGDSHPHQAQQPTPLEV